MAKLTGPLLSFGSRGQIGKAMVTANWKGIDYARQYVIPANPRTTAQQANRTRFAFLREMWKLAPAAVQAPWNEFARGRPFLGFNKFVGENNRLLAALPVATDLSRLLFSPGAGGGLPPAAVSAVAGANPGEVDWTLDAPPVLPDDWSIVSVTAAAVLDQDPVGIFTGPFTAQTVMAGPYEGTIAGFPDGEDVVVGAFIQYEKANGEPAFSVSIVDVTPSGT